MNITDQPSTPEATETPPPLPIHDLFICTLPPRTATVSEVNTWLLSWSEHAQSEISCLKTEGQINGTMLRKLTNRALYLALTSSGLDLLVAHELAADIERAVRLEEDLREGRGKLIPEELRDSLEKVWMRRSWDERQAVRKAVEEGRGIGVTVKSSGAVEESRDHKGCIDYVDHK